MVNFILSQNPLLIVLSASWALATLFSPARIQRNLAYWITVASASFALFSSSPEAKVLAWMTCLWSGYFIALVEGWRSGSGLGQKYFIIQFLAATSVGLGVAVSSSPVAPYLVLIGVLVSLPNVFYSLVFHSFFMSISRRAFLYSIILPSIVILNFLLSQKEQFSAQLDWLWGIVPLVLGFLGLLLNSVFSLIRNDSKSVFIAQAQAWLGLLLVLTTESSPTGLLAFVSIASFLMCGFPLSLEVKRYSKGVGFFIVASLMGLPGFLGFNAVFYSIRSLNPQQVFGLSLLLIALFFQSAAWIRGYTGNKNRNEVVPFRFYLLCILNGSLSIVIHLIGANHGVD
jgi:hypothetical protein